MSDRFRSECGQSQNQRLVDPLSALTERPRSEARWIQDIMVRVDAMCLHSRHHADALLLGHAEDDIGPAHHITYQRLCGVERRGDSPLLQSDSRLGGQRSTGDGA